MTIYFVKGLSKMNDGSFYKQNIKVFQNIEKAKEFKNNCLKNGKKLITRNYLLNNFEEANKREILFSDKNEEYENYVVEEVEL